MRYTTYRCGKAVIKDKNKLSEAIEKLAEFEEKEKCGEWLDAIELAKITIALQSQKWIPCNERMTKGTVLCCDDRGNMLVGLLCKDEAGYMAYGDDGQEMYNCVAWMPLPEPYKQNDEGVEK